MAWDFKPGMRVVCVESGFGVIKGAVYTLRWAGTCRFRLPNGGVGVLPAVRLMEVARTDIGYPDYPYAAVRFRPVDERSLDQFRVHLAPIKQHEEA